MSFTETNQNPNVGAAHLYVLPWLQVPTPISFGQMEVAPASACLDPTDPRTPGARRVLGCYKNLDGRPVHYPALMWTQGSGPLDLRAADQSDLERHRLALSAALIIESAYYMNWTGLGAVSAGHCEGFLHSFESAEQHTAIYKRRREGWYADGWPLDKLNITVPLPASPQHQFAFDSSLCDALLQATSSALQLGDRLERALPAFLQGNQLSNSTTMLDDLVWMGAAFERLLGITVDVGRNLSVEIAALFPDITEHQTNWTHVSRSGNPINESGPWRQRWMREFYDRRSTVHSGTGQQGTWTDLFHGVIAAEVFSLAVLRLLADAGLRLLAEAEAIRQDALDARIEALASKPADIGGEWARCLDEAGRRWLRTAVAQSLVQPPDGAT